MVDLRHQFAVVLQAKSQQKMPKYVESRLVAESDLNVREQRHSNTGGSVWINEFMDRYGGTNPGAMPDQLPVRISANSY